MKIVLKALVAAGFVGSLAMPAFAQSEMTCEEFMAMDSEGQMAAMEEMDAMAMEAEGAEAEPAEEMSEEDAMAMQEESMATIMAACEEDPSMMVGDTMSDDG